MDYYMELLFNISTLGYPLNHPLLLTNRQSCHTPPQLITIFKS